MTAPGSKKLYTWRDYDYGRSSPRQGSTGSSSSRVHFNEPSSAADTARIEIPRSSNEDNGDLGDGLRRRRSSISMRINSLAQVGGLNSLENFARSWQRAAAFNELPSRRSAFVVSAEDEEEAIGARRSEPSPTERRSLLRQQLERQESSSQAIIDDVPSNAASISKQAHAGSSDTRGTDVVDRAPYLASPYASSNGGIYGSLASRVNDSSLQHAGKLFDEQQLCGVGEPDKEDEPLLIRRVEQEDGKIIEEVIGRSTLPQTILNSVNVLVGVGILSLPLAMRYSGWAFGMTSLLFAALSTRYTARILARCLDRYPSVTHFSELGSAAFGIKTRIAVEILITLELAAACVALVVLFADSLDALIPGWGIVEWKIVCGIVVLPLNFVPLRYLSITSVFGVMCSMGIVVLVLIHGLMKGDFPGSLREPAPTHLFPEQWSTLPLSFGLFMEAPWGGHTVFPSIYRDMRHPRKFRKGAYIIFISTYIIDGTMAVVGWLMFGTRVRDEITSNIILTRGYSRVISIIMVVFIAIIPITKIPLNTRPIISSADKILGLDARSVASPPGLAGLSGYSRGLIRGAVRAVLTVVILVVAIFVPSFDTVMSLMGSVFCFTICIILPLAFYLKIFDMEISKREKAFDWFMIMISALLGIVGTVWVFLPASMTGANGDAFTAVQDSSSSFAVIPFENSTYGTVIFTLDLLVDREAVYPDLLVCGEYFLPVRHSLLGHPSQSQSQDPSGERTSQEHVEAPTDNKPRQPLQGKLDLGKISTVYSHPQALGQCEHFLAQHVKGAEKREISSTSKAAERVAKEGPESQAAAISSSLAAEMYGLTILAESIQDKDDNTTRFFILKNRKTECESHDLPLHQKSPVDHGGWKSLISFTLAEQPSGTLADVLQIFKDHDLNLTGIHSRPSLQHAWHYVFLIEVQGRREATGGVMDQALRELETKTKGWRWLGSWVDRSEQGKHEVSSLQ
ncbi:MAG: hypothetical protein L6R35_004063 [Caloplaca aegaea]|nr:MAG: hypothetical protein L6R35_004063 [Caloplaca aegaea]